MQIGALASRLTSQTSIANVRSAIERYTEPATARESSQTRYRYAQKISDLSDLPLTSQKAISTYQYCEMVGGQSPESQIMGIDFHV